jgi:hypothetical protein
VSVRLSTGAQVCAGEAQEGVAEGTNQIQRNIIARNLIAD